MALYFTRHDSMTQATTTFAPVETDSEGATAGPIAIPPGTKAIKSIRAVCVIDGAQTTVTGFIAVLRLSGVAALPNGTQELVLFSEHLEDGGGTLTYTDSQIVPMLVLPTDIQVNPGADLSLSAAYFGADPGSPQIAVTLEFV